METLWPQLYINKTDSVSLFPWCKCEFVKEKKKLTRKWLTKTRSVISHEVPETDETQCASEIWEKEPQVSKQGSLLGSRDF